jgi:hypothetical protein
VLHLHLNNERGRPKSTRGPQKFCAAQIGASKNRKRSTMAFYATPLGDAIGGLFQRFADCPRGIDKF